MAEPSPSSNALALARQYLGAYGAAIFPSYSLAAHLRLIISTLEAVERGEIKRLMIFMPPRHGKSLTSTEIFPAWYLGRHPDRFVISASYGAELAVTFGRMVRNFLTDPLHQAIFPNCRLSGDSAAMQRFATTAGGTYYAVGRGGPISGRGANLLLLDDTLKDKEEARSELVCRSLWDWYQHVAYTRLQPGGAIVLIQTRWSENDLAGWLLREHPDEKWHVLSLPAIAEPNDPLGRAEGEALWPEQFPIAELERIKKQIGGGAFSPLYQQRPAAAEGVVFKREWMLTYRDRPLKFEKVIQSWDTGFKAGADNDYSVCTTWGVTDNAYYLLSVFRDRLEFPALKHEVGVQADFWKPHEILVEDKASGQSLIQELKLATTRTVLAIKVDKDKRTRAEAITPMWEAGKVLLPEAAPWLDDYKTELADFPTGAHDDMVDSTSQALNHLRGGSGWFWDNVHAAVKIMLGIRDAVTTTASTAEDLATDLLAPAAEPDHPVDAPPPVVEQCQNPNCGSRNLTAQPGAWLVRCSCGWSRDMTPEEIGRARTSVEFQRSQEGWRGGGSVLSDTGRPIIVPKASATPSAPGANSGCPVCGRPLAEREDSMGAKIQTCNACGFQKFTPQSGYKRRGGGRVA